jgi:hypothetical protein
MKDAIALTNFQLDMIKHAAAQLSQSHRSEFLQDIALHLAGQPSNDAVVAAINLVLDRVPQKGNAL